MVASKRRYWNGTVTIGGGSGATYADYVVSITLHLRIAPMLMVDLGVAPGGDIFSSPE
jgi:hypothetical protein